MSAGRPLGQGVCPPLDADPDLTFFFDADPDPDSAPETDLSLILGQIFNFKCT